MGDSGLAVVRAGTAQLFESHVFAGHRFDHIGAGDEHVRRLIHHDGEIGDSGGVDRAASAGAHDQRDLRNHPAGTDIAHEDFAVLTQRDHTLLNPCTTGIVDTNDRAAGLEGQIHDLDDFLAENFAE